MGNQMICCQKPEKIDFQIVPYQQQGYLSGRNNVQTYRRGYPSEIIAIQLQSILTKYDSQTDIKFLQSMIKKVLAHQKKNDKLNKTFQVNQSKIQRNYINKAYYIPFLKIFYIGQWVYDIEIEQNIPGGIGRIYSEEWIQEGVISSQCSKAMKQIKQKKMTLLPNKLQQAKSSRSIAAKQNQNPLSRLNSSLVKLSIELNGKGRRFNKHERFEGDFQKGVLQGQGKHFIFSLSYQYQGSWEKGKKNGKGSQKTQQYTYYGQFKQDEKNGKGHLQYHLGKVIEQGIKHQLQIFEAKMNENSEKLRKRVQKNIQEQKKFQSQLDILLKQFKWKNPFDQESVLQNQAFVIEHLLKKSFKQTYSGGFKDNKKNGNGIYVWNNGRVYNGQWFDDNMEGIGEFLWPQGSYYRGQYQNDLKHGKGEMVWCTEKRYRGHWAFGIRHGYGQSIEADHNIIKISGALWQQDKKSKTFFSRQFNMLQSLKIIANHQLVKTYLEQDDQEGSYYSQQHIQEGAQNVVNKIVTIFTQDQQDQPEQLSKINYK